jgi:hypothetical protein
MPTAQEAFARMVKEEIAPGLRRMGFKGSGQRYELPSETHWAMLSFQKSAFSDSDDVRFTINLKVIGREEWQRARQERSYLGERPSPSVFANVGWESRIGRLLPGDRDQWWTVTADGPTEPVAREILEAVKEFAFPAMIERMTGSGSAA